MFTVQASSVMMEGGDGHPAAEVSLEFPLVEVGSGWEFQISILRFSRSPTSTSSPRRDRAEPLPLQLNPGSKSNRKGAAKYTRHRICPSIRPLSRARIDRTKNRPDFR